MDNNGYNNNFDNGYNYNHDNNFNNFNRNNYPQERRGMAIASLILGILSIPAGCCTGYMGPLLGIIAVFLGIFSKGTAPVRSGKAIAGIITGAVGAIIGIIMFIMAIYLMGDPEFMAQYEELMEFYNR